MDRINQSRRPPQVNMHAEVPLHAGCLDVPSANEGHGRHPPQHATLLSAKAASSRCWCCMHACELQRTCRHKASESCLASGAELWCAGLWCAPPWPSRRRPSHSSSCPCRMHCHFQVLHCSTAKCRHRCRRNRRSRRSRRRRTRTRSGCCTSWCPARLRVWRPDQTLYRFGSKHRHQSSSRCRCHCFPRTGQSTCAARITAPSTTTTPPLA